MGLYLSQRPVYRARRRAVLLVAVLLAMVAVVVAWRLTQRAVPGTTVAGQDVSGYSESQIAGLAATLDDGFVVDVTVEGRTATATAKDIGVQVDARATARAAMTAGRGPGLAARYSLDIPTVVPVAVTYDAAALRAWLDTAFSDVAKTPSLPVVAFDPATGRAGVTPGVAGATIDTEPLAERLPALVAARERGGVTLGVVAAAPAIDDTTAATAQAQFDAYLTTPLELVSPDDGQVVAQPSAADIAGWIVVTPHPEWGTFTVDLDDAAVRAYVADQVVPAVTVPPVDREVMTDADGAPAGELKPGVAGRALADPAALATTWLAALDAQGDGVVTATWASVDYGSRAVPADSLTPPVTHAGHWVDVDLGAQTAILYDGARAVQAFTISSGGPGTATPTGHFQVYAKVASQTLSGPDFRYGDVPWCVWFFGNIGFHTAYWHDNFGTAVSHGCVNMREADAHALYDWMAVGGHVEVHA